MSGCNGFGSVFADAAGTWESKVHRIGRATDIKSPRWAFNARFESIFDCRMRLLSQTEGGVTWVKQWMSAVQPAMDIREASDVHGPLQISLVFETVNQ